VGFRNYNTGGSLLHVQHQSGHKDSTLQYFSGFG
jgi:hypothetical protein